MSRRWWIVLVTAATLVVAPLLVAARPASGVRISGVELAGRIQTSAAQGWSGYVESTGTLSVPDSHSFSSLVQLLTQRNDLRVWWRSADDWRIDRMTDTGETDLIRQRSMSLRWVFESETATVSPVSLVRLPDVSDLVPPTLARAILAGARADELTALPARRIAGISAAGLRLTPRGEPTTLAHVDLWADPATGVALRVEIYGHNDPRPVLTTALRQVDEAMPDATTTGFDPAEGVSIAYDQSLDVAAAANAFAPFDPPHTLAGLPARTGIGSRAIGRYGRGPTTLLAVPLREEVAGPLRQQLEARADPRYRSAGTLVAVGPVDLLVTPYGNGDTAYLLAGTVDPDTLRRAATELGVRP